MIKKLNFNYSEKGGFITPIQQNLSDWCDFMAPIRKLCAISAWTRQKINIPF